MCQLSLSLPLACYDGKYAWTSYKACQTSPPLPCAPPPPTHSANIPQIPVRQSAHDHINLELSYLLSPKLSLTCCPNTPPHAPTPSFHVLISFSPSQSVWVSEFPPQCRIPHLINRYAGMIGIGQQAVLMIPESYWDYRVQLSMLLVDPFIVQ